MLVHHFQRQFPKDSIIDNLEDGIHGIHPGIPMACGLVTGQFPEQKAAFCIFDLASNYNHL